MRILAVHPGASFSTADVFVGWTEALAELGVTVHRYNLDTRLIFHENALVRVGDAKFKKAFTGDQAKDLAIDGLYSQLFRHRPDVLLVVSGAFVPHDLCDRAREAGTRVVVVHTEQPYELDRELALAAHADVNLINDPTHIEQFRQVAKTWYVPHAYRPTLHHPGPAVPELMCDFGFVGTAFPSRIAFFEAMDLSGLDVLLGGSWQKLPDESPLRQYVGHDIRSCMENTETANLYRSAKVGINLYRREAQRPELSAGWAMGPREVEMAACGMFFLREQRPEGDHLFPGLPRFESPAEASELLRWWLNHDRLRQDAADAARLAISDRTFVNHAKHLLRVLGA